MRPLRQHDSAGRSRSILGAFVFTQPCGGESDCATASLIRLSLEDHEGRVVSGRIDVLRAGCATRR